MQIDQRLIVLARSLQLFIVLAKNQPRAFP